ncbi:MAG: molybdenum cofactor biosynthesis protein MoaE [Desulfobacterales bacterium]|uniref:Molybdopterin synthase catalytic subunit n=1 Tax=Candidatus Desulfatibia profunda TaxID=2841695 RepID=A0A8J6TP33_9BACT|nr:molybdenum cofactor biosynthesis protein MoaE [Candidatus Desulfatibia profunda]MBL7178772.1 molybdenum cofactor biosynthesis protein MoaE [Desulfobacterales bacterium]
MSLTRMLDTIKKHPDYHNAGMILCHNGVVRSTSRNGQKVSGLMITVNHQKLQQVIAISKQIPGIIEVLVEINENRKLSVGADVMFLVVAGDVRENVIRALTDTLNAIKTTVTQKIEFFE